jgi:hypothetical protein
LMITAVVFAWMKNTWNIWYRIYYTLLTLSAAACMIILLKWQVLTALI